MNDSPSIRRQILQMDTIKIGTKQSSKLSDHQDALNKFMKSNQSLSDLKKEFINFKQNVLQ